jgi:hypothetical protein
MRRAVMMMVAVVGMIWRSVNNPGISGVAVVSHYEGDNVRKGLDCGCERFLGYCLIEYELCWCDNLIEGPT